MKTRNHTYWYIAVLILCLPAAGQIRAEELSMDPADELLQLLYEETPRPAATVQMADSNSVNTETAKAAVNANAEGAVEVSGSAVSRYGYVPEAVRDFRDLRKQLFAGQIEPVDEAGKSRKEAGLNDLIQQLRALETPDKITPQAGQTTQGPSAGTSSQGEEKTAPEASDEKLTEIIAEPENKVLKELEKADAVVDPLRLADVLYRNGYPALAYPYYEQAAKSLSEEDSATHQWIIFQMGNCRQNDDPQAAMALYAKLMQAYPGSPWTGAANCRLKLLEWSQTNRIQTYAKKGTE